MAALASTPIRRPEGKAAVLGHHESEVPTTTPIRRRERNAAVLRARKSPRPRRIFADDIESPRPRRIFADDIESPRPRRLARRIFGAEVLEAADLGASPRPRRLGIAASTPPLCATARRLSSPPLSATARRLSSPPMGSGSDRAKLAFILEKPVRMYRARPGWRKWPRFCRSSQAATPPRHLRAPIAAATPSGAAGAGAAGGGVGAPGAAGAGAAGGGVGPPSAAGAGAGGGDVGPPSAAGAGAAGGGAGPPSAAGAGAAAGGAGPPSAAPPPPPPPSAVALLPYNSFAPSCSGGVPPDDPPPASPAVPRPPNSGPNDRFFNWELGHLAMAASTLGLIYIKWAIEQTASWEKSRFPMKVLAISMMMGFSCVGIGLMASTSSRASPVLKLTASVLARLSSVIAICAIIIMSAEPAGICGWGIVNACVAGVLMGITWFLGNGDPECLERLEAGWTLFRNRFSGFQSWVTDGVMSATLLATSSLSWLWNWFSVLQGWVKDAGVSVTVFITSRLSWLRIWFSGLQAGLRMPPPRASP